jgi:hypothetical protein
MRLRAEVSKNDKLASPMLTYIWRTTCTADAPLPTTHTVLSFHASGPNSKSQFAVCMSCTSVRNIQRWC